MKNIAVLTINDNNNYGNRLQSYAVQETIKKFNCNVENIENIRKEPIIKKFVKIFIKKIFCIFNIKNQRNIENRKKYFKNFNKNIKFSKYKIINEKYKEGLGDIYDCFFTGSDQVWNPNFGRMSDIDFLTFTSKSKRNSFSASFGISKLPENLKEYYKTRINELNNISVREEKAKDIIQELTKRKDVKVLIDPTMMLKDKDWDKVCKKPKQLQTNNYILNYFLGQLSDDKKQEIERIAKENNCEIINILDKNSSFYKTGPSEFLYLEKNAFLICTDSFHSCVFAILYNKPFIVFNRQGKSESMNSRIETLLSKFKLENRYYNGKITTELLECNYKEAYEILDKERGKTETFLKQVLNIKEE